jgi:hypothetical protein
MKKSFYLTKPITFVAIAIKLNGINLGLLAGPNNNIVGVKESTGCFNWILVLDSILKWTILLLTFSHNYNLAWPVQMSSTISK